MSQSHLAGVSEALTPGYVAHLLKITARIQHFGMKIKYPMLKIQ